MKKMEREVVDMIKKGIEVDDMTTKGIEVGDTKKKEKDDINGRVRNKGVKDMQAGVGTTKDQQS